MAYAVKYNLPVRNGLTGDAYLLEIQEDGFVGTAGILKGSDKPLQLKYIDNDENKYAPIRASELTINFISEAFDMESIISNNDQKYRVDLRRITPSGSQLNWRGFLSTDDLTEQYISGNRQFSLKAIDGLGFLKNETPSFTYGRILLTEVIQECLSKTYVGLDFNIECSLYADYMADFVFSNPFSQCKIHTRYYMNSDNGPGNLYEVLEELMKTFQCTAFQQGGYWHIKRMPDERIAASASSNIYNITDLSTSTGTFDWLTERNIDFIPVNASHQMLYVKATGESKYQHDYIVPEVPANNDLTEGGRFPFYDTANSRGYLINYHSYEYGNILSPSIGQAYRSEVFDADDNIVESYAVLPHFGTNDERLRSTDDPYVDEGDKITVTASTRLNVDNSLTTSDTVLRIYLFGDSGQKYAWDGAGDAWDPTLVSALGPGALVRSYDNSDDLTEWYDFSVECKPFPEGGRLELWWCDWSNGAADETWFKDITVSYRVFYNQLANIRGERSIASDGEVSRKKNEVNITAGETPKRIIAGSLWKDSPDTELVGNKWHTFQSSTERRLIDINSSDLQYGSFRTMRIIDGDFKGIKWTREDERLIGPGNTFSIDGTRYIATNLDIDIANGIWTGSLVELSNDTRDEAYTGTIDTDFKYLFGNERS